MNMLEVGNTVYLKPVNNNARYGNKEIEEYEIKKIGRKYFEVWKDGKQYTTRKFHIEDYRQETNYIPDWKLYFSKQEILDEQEFEGLLKEIRNVFGNYGKPDLTLDKLRKIKEIIS